MGQAILPILLIASAASTMGSAIYSGSQQKSGAAKARRQQRGLTAFEHQRWKETAYPTQAEKESAAGKLGQARLASYQNLASQLATRGFGPGSTMGAGMARGIESDYGRAYANMLAQMSRPKWPPPGITGGPYYMGAGPGAAGAAAGSDWLGQAAGYYWMNQMLQGGANPYATMLPWGTAGGMVTPFGAG